VPVQNKPKMCSTSPHPPSCDPKLTAERRLKKKKFRQQIKIFPHLFGGFLGGENHTTVLRLLHNADKHVSTAFTLKMEVITESESLVTIKASQYSSTEVLDTVH
jgi:hypothetical protein